MLPQVRIDKWLWSVRLFKSRTLATDAVKAGRVKIKGEPIKPSYLLKRGELVQIRKEGFHLTFKVVDLLDKRVGAALAQPCYENQTSQEELNKYNSWYLGRAGAEIRDKGTGRPTKKERRQIDGFKDDEDDFEWDLD